MKNVETITKSWLCSKDKLLLIKRKKKSWTSEKNNSDTAIGYFLLPG